jgi:cytochrome b561
MQVANPSSGYSATAKTFHWLTVILVIAGWLLGQFGDDLPHPWHQTGLVVHIAIGTTVFLLLLARLLWRFIDPPPPAEKTVLGTAGEIGAKLVHYAIYALLIAIPVAGVVTQFARGHALPIYGLFEIASPWVRDRAFAHSMVELHEWLANALMILALVHAAAALGHHYVLRDGTLRRMLPGPIGRSGVSAHAKVSRA